MIELFQDLLPFFAISFAINGIGLVVAYRLQTDKLTDASYALTFVAVTLFALIQVERIEVEQVVASVVVFLWAIRLATYLVARVTKFGKDARFDDKRSSFKKFGQFWLLQALAVPIILLPVEMLFIGDLARTAVLPVLITGVVISLFGLLFETIADAQKFKFITQKPKPKGWIETGLWKYSRHPNYFGEIMVWYGLFVVATSVVEPLSQVLVASVGPLSIAGLLLFASGIPILEKKADQKWGNIKKYQEYKKRTSILVPLPPRKD